MSSFSGWTPIESKMSFDVMSSDVGTAQVSCMILVLCRGRVHNVTAQLAKVNGVITKVSNKVSLNFGVFNDHQRLKDAQAQVQFVTTIKCI